MKKLAAILAAGAFALTSAAFAQTAAPATAPKAAPAAAAKLEKPAGIAQDAWDKMSEADKKTAIEKAKAAAPKATDKAAAAPAAAKKEKKGGC